MRMPLLILELYFKEGLRKVLIGSFLRESRVNILAFNWLKIFRQGEGGQFTIRFLKLTFGL